MAAIHETIVKIGENLYRLISDDEYVDTIGKEFEPDSVRLYRALIRQSDVVLDIGANVGCTAILFGDLAATVCAFEPSPSTFSFLQQNVAISGKENVRLHNYGLGSESETATLTFSKNNRSGGFVSKTQASAGHVIENIAIRRLDEVVGELGLARIDFIKIDVEGFEGHVLRGANEALAKHRPTVVSELNHWCLNAFQRTSVPDHFDFLRSVFPILLAVDGERYLDLHNANESYIVMFQHINRGLFPSIIGAFDESRVASFRAGWKHDFRIKPKT
jgi:FkbM family methyltransferase